MDTLSTSQDTEYFHHCRSPTGLLLTVVRGETVQSGEEATSLYGRRVATSSKYIRFLRHIY